jgi:hypothetical protein
MVLPDEESARSARVQLPAAPPIAAQAGGLAEVLSQASLAIASSGTVTLECAYFGVPTLVLYKLSPLEFQIARRMVRVKHIAMPNLLAGETVFPEFLQQRGAGKAGGGGPGTAGGCGRLRSGAEAVGPGDRLAGRAWRGPPCRPRHHWSPIAGAPGWLRGPPRPPAE